MPVIEEDVALDEVLDAVERHLMRAARRLLFEDAADSPLWDLPLPQIRALHMIAHRPNVAMGRVAERLGVAMSTATQIADRLEQRGWVRRVDDRDDRRIVRLALTEAGHQVVEQRRQQRRERLRQALVRMPEETRQALIDGLRTLNEAGGSDGCNHHCGSASSILNWVREDLDAETGDGNEADGKA